LNQNTIRSATEVLDDHLQASKTFSVEEDLARNFSEDLLILTGVGVYRGHDGIRELAELLRQQLPNATFGYCTRIVEGELGFLEWTARADGAYVDDGGDSYLIRDGRIVTQSIHYTVKRLEA
jgi:hypothetical protein